MVWKPRLVREATLFRLLEFIKIFPGGGGGGKGGLKLSDACETRPVENKGNDYLIKKLLTVKQILLVSTS